MDAGEAQQRVKIRVFACWFVAGKAKVVMTYSSHFPKESRIGCKIVFKHAWCTRST